MTYKKSAAPDHPPTEQIGELVLGSVTFPLYQGLLTTADAVMKRSAEDIERAYAGLTGDGVKHKVNVLMRRAVGGAVQAAWYTTQGMEVPMTVQENQEARVAEAVAANAEAPLSLIPEAPVGSFETAPVANTPGVGAPASKKNPSKGMVPAVRALIAEGKTDEEIVTALKPTFKPCTLGVVKSCRARSGKQGA